MLQKGWRCLDCTVCEGCGKQHDEARLILCDEGDISYHIYCLDPPLDAVPTGTWKCKWCIMCLTCGATTPGTGSCQWQNNYSQCGPCSSLEMCPVCGVSYYEGELIIQCLHCQRWATIVNLTSRLCLISIFIPQNNMLLWGSAFCLEWVGVCLGRTLTRNAVNRFA